MPAQIKAQKPNQSLRKMLHKIVPISDAELLSLYIDQADSAAFGELVKRYSPLIMGVASRYCSSADSEDVFQATFALLARDAAKIRQRDNLAGWLYRIAFRKR